MNLKETNLKNYVDDDGSKSHFLKVSKLYFHPLSKSVFDVKNQQIFFQFSFFSFKNMNLRGHILAKTLFPKIVPNF